MTDATAWCEGRFDGREAFRQAVRAAVRRAADEGWPSMLWCDADFRDWPLAEQAVCADLQRWAHQGGHLRMMAVDFRSVQSGHHRFVVWRRQWDHRFQARATGRRKLAETPCLLVAPDACLWRADPVHGGFVISADAGLRARWLEQVESLWQQAGVSFPASTLGL